MEIRLATCGKPMILLGLEKRVPKNVTISANFWGPSPLPERFISVSIGVELFR